MERGARHGTAAALLAAGLFGATAPVAKKLLENSGIAALSCLLYFGAFLALTVSSVLLGPSSESPLRPSDVPKLAAVAVIGGIGGPLLLLYGLQRTSGIAGSLLLNLEAPLTLLLAVLVFGEHLSTRMTLAATAMFAGAGLVTADPGRSYASVAGALAIAGACLAWAIDNNLTQRLSLRNPVQLAQAKTATAAAGLAVVAVATGSTFPPWRIGMVALAVGALGYGFSIVLDVVALRLIGAARESALFAVAPFAGALVAIPLLSEHLTTGTGVAAVLMVLGAVAFVSERHEHLHEHEAIEHEHVHEHDAHHRHVHEEIIEGRHSHPHRHEETVHAHGHASDVHHRHGH